MIADLKVLSDALTQYIDNQPELDDEEPEAPEVERARQMLDMVDAMWLSSLEAPDEQMMEKWFCTDMFEQSMRAGDLAAAIGWVARTP